MGILIIFIKKIFLILYISFFIKFLRVLLCRKSLFSCILVNTIKRSITLFTFTIFRYNKILFPLVFSLSLCLNKRVPWSPVSRLSLLTVFLYSLVDLSYVTPTFIAFRTFLGRKKVFVVSVSTFRLTHKAE